MRFKGFVGSSYNLKNVDYDCQRTVNWYPEVDETTLGKNAEIAQLVPTPGLLPVVTGLQGPSRGGYVASNNQVFWVFGQTLYQLSVSGTTVIATKINGNIAGASRCNFTDNGTTMFILGDYHGYTMNLSTKVVSTITTNWNNASSLTYYDTYVVFSRVNSNTFFWTNPVSTEIEALNFASAEANSDRIVGLINNNEDLWIFGKRTTELWYNYGGQNNVVFARRPSILIETGCASANTIKKLNNTIFWLSEDDRGGPMLMMANGYTPQRVSTYAIEQEWMRSSAGQFGTATAYAYQWGGHYFYCIDIPGQNTTWVYDMTVSQQIGQPVWHERRSRDITTNEEGRYYANDHVYTRGVHLMGDYRKGTLYALSETTYTDNGQPVTRERTTPHVSNSMDRVFFSNLTIDVATGVSTDPDLTPRVQLEFSDDGGYTWSEPRMSSSGMQGQYGGKVQFPRLGSARNRVFRVRCVDPVYWAIAGADIELRSGIH